jgi:hypothetical protein
MLHRLSNRLTLTLNHHINLLALQWHRSYPNPTPSHSRSLKALFLRRSPSNNTNRLHGLQVLYRLHSPCSITSRLRSRRVIHQRRNTFSSQVATSQRRSIHPCPPRQRRLRLHQLRQASTTHLPVLEQAETPRRRHRLRKSAAIAGELSLVERAFGQNEQSWPVICAFALMLYMFNFAISSVPAKGVFVFES